MPIDTTCPGCQAKLRIGDEFAGQQARCPRCDATYLVPSAPQDADLPSPVGQVSNLPFPPSPSTSPAAAPPPLPPTLSPVEEQPTEPAPDPLRAVLDSLPAPAPAELPPPDGTQWFLRTPEGPIYGPTSEPTFQRWVVEGRVTPDCFVSPGDNVWRPAGELFPELTAPRPKLQLRPETMEAVRKQPHRGALILLLGIMGIVTTCPIPSIMAWVMGSYDLGEMQAGRMDDAGHSLTNGGRLLGLIFSLLYIGLAVIGMFALVFVFARG